MAESPEQWPIVGYEDLYYGGTGYKNDQGLGIQLAPLGGQLPEKPEAPQMPAADLVAVPVTSLYDHGTTVQPSKVLQPRIPQPFITMNPLDAEKQKATDGMTVRIDVNGALATVVVKIDPNIPAGFALVPRSMGVAITEPVGVKIQVAVEA